MPEASNSISWNQATWDIVPSYRLNKSDIEKFLTKKFGRVDFFIEVS